MTTQEVRRPAARKKRPDALHPGAVIALGNPEPRSRATGTGDWSKGVCRLLATGDALIISATLLLTALLTWPQVEAIIQASGRRIPLASFLLGSTLLAVGWLALLAITGSRDPRFLGQGSEEYRRVIVATVLTIVSYATLGFFADLTVARLPALGLPIGGLGLLLWRLIARRWLVRRRAEGLLLTNIALLGSPSDEIELSSRSGATIAAGFSIVTTIAADRDRPTIDDVQKVVHQAAASGASLVLALPNTGYSPLDIRLLFWALESRGIGLAMSPAVSEVSSHRLPLRTIDGLPLLFIEPPQLTGVARAGKRLFDIAFSAFALAIAVVPMLIIAMFIRLDSKGPTLFVQRRVGKDGRYFNCYKFRTMVREADTERASLREAVDCEGAAFKMRSDPRITRIGTLLRRFSLDESPQLFNVLKGDMSIVGPRPHPEDDVTRYKRHEHRRLLVKPGLTGLWQVSGRSDLAWNEAVQLDLRYVENWTFTDDLFLVAKTLRAVVTGKGAY